MGNGFENVATDTLIQEHVPRRARGRLFGVVYSGALAGDTLASFVGGPLVDITSARTTLAIAGAGALVGDPGKPPKRVSRRRALATLEDVKSVIEHWAVE